MNARQIADALAASCSDSDRRAVKDFLYAAVDGLYRDGAEPIDDRSAEILNDLIIALTTSSTGSFRKLLYPQRSARVWAVAFHRALVADAVDVAELGLVVEILGDAANQLDVLRNPASAHFHQLREEIVRLYNKGIWRP